MPLDAPVTSAVSLRIGVYYDVRVERVSPDSRQESRRHRPPSNPSDRRNGSPSSGVVPRRVVMNELAGVPRCSRRSFSGTLDTSKRLALCEDPDRHMTMGPVLLGLLVVASSRSQPVRS